MKRLSIVLIFLINLVLDFTVLSRFNIFGYIPSITIPLIIILSMYTQSENMYYYSIFQGLFQDVAFSGVLGVKALVYYLVSYYTNKFDYKKNFSLLFANLILIFTLIFKFVISTGYQAFNNRSMMFVIIRQKVFAFGFEIAFSTLVLILLYVVCYQLRKTKSRKYI